MERKKIGPNVIVCTGGKWESIHGEDKYVRGIVNNFGMFIPDDINYLLLCQMVKERVSIGDNQELLLSFKHPEEGYVMNIVNGSDISMLQWVLSESRKMVHLYTVISAPVVEDFVISSSRKDSNTASGSGTFKRQVPKKDYDDEAVSDDDFSQKTGGSNPFYFMPPIPPSQAPIPEPQSTCSMGHSDKITYLQTFKDKDALVLACRMKALREKFQYTTRYSDRKRYDIICQESDKGCPWRLYAVGCSKDERFKVKVLNDEHNCTSSMLLPNHKQAKKSVLGTIIHDLMGKDISRKWRPKEIVSDMNTNYDVNVSYKKAWGARHYAHEMMQGSPEESFTQLPTYFHYLKLHNPGTVTFIDVDSEGRFEQCFFTLGCAIRAFKTTCRKVMIMDGAHLKGKFKGTILHAVGLDGNTQILPVGYGICKSESTSSWTWFLERLRESLGDCEELMFVTDRAASIAASIQNVYPESFHACCGQHLLGNVTTAVKKKRNKTTGDMFWGLAFAFTPQDFEEQWKTFARRRPAEAAFLATVPKEQWTRAYCPRVRYDFLTSNYAESINALSVYARKEPIVALIEFFRATQQRWFYERGILAAECSSVLTPTAEKKVEENKSHIRGWRPHGISRDGKYQVDDRGRGAIVDIYEKTCTCRVWQLTGIPCGHVAVALTFLGQTSLASLAMKEYTTETYRKTYQECVYPVPMPQDWEELEDMMVVLPPVMERRQAGRPRNTNRIPSQGGEPTPRFCSRCGQLGHTCRECTTFAPSHYQRKGKAKVGASGSGTNASRTNANETEVTHEAEDGYNFSTYDLNLNEPPSWL